MKARYLPSDHTQQLFQSYQQCAKKRRPVDEYAEEFYRLGSRDNIPETEAQQVSRYLSGLDTEIKEALYLHPISKVTEAVSLAQKIELQPKMLAKVPGDLKRIKPSLETPTESPPTPSTFQTPPLPKVPTIDASALKKSNNPYRKPSGDKCYSCGLLGHHPNDCPKRRPVRLVEDDKTTDDEDVHHVYSDEVAHAILVVRKVLQRDVKSKK
ncbi:hypothetical protein MKW92_050695, partial [Papaver armeniacum]